MFWIPVALLFFFLLVFHLLISPEDPHRHSYALFSAAMIAFWLRKVHGLRFFLSSLRKNFFAVLPAMEILLLVGILVGVWSKMGILSGLVQWGFLHLDAKYFYPSVTLFTAVGALFCGSSWTTAGTIGVALVGLSHAFGFSEAITAGAVVSGCYFGDKLSPLSDTTILSSSLTGVPILQHIRWMLRTTCLSFGLSLLVFALLQWWQNQIPVTKNAEFPFSSYHHFFWIPLVSVFGLSMAKVTARWSLLTGIVTAICLNGTPDIMELPPLVHVMFLGYKVMGSSLTFGSGGGIISVLPTEILILSAIVFAASFEAGGYLSEFLKWIRKFIHSPSDLLLSTMGSAFFLNVVTADQYLSLVVPARSFRELAIQFEVPPKNISRALEDSGTVSSPLIPWNSCGAFMATSLGVSVWVYFPYACFNWIHIFLSLWNAKRNQPKSS